MALGENIKRLRKLAGLTQGQLADMADMKLGHISKLERNETDAKVSTIYKLMDALGCTANDLLQSAGAGGLSQMLEQAISMAESLPGRDKAALLNLVEKYCLAASITEVVKNTGGIPQEVIAGIDHDVNANRDGESEIERMIADEERGRYWDESANRDH